MLVGKRSEDDPIFIAAVKYNIVGLDNGHYLLRVLGWGSAFSFA
jgi:hypothetical protein